MDENAVSKVIVDAALSIHKRVGPGLLESAYKAILVHELRKRGLVVFHEVLMPLVYDELEIEDAYWIDLIVQHLVIVEIKAVVEVHPVHKKQLMTYLKFMNKRLGLLINFSALRIKEGITRIANGMPT